MNPDEEDPVAAASAAARQRRTTIGGGPTRPSSTPPSPQLVVFQNFARPFPVHNNTIVFTFSTSSYGEPQDGDWIGLFRMKKTIRDSCNDISFVWAKDESALLSSGVYQASLRLYHDEDLEPNVLFCLSYVTMSCQFIGCSKKFLIQNNQVIPEDGTTSVNRSSKCHPECYGEEGDCNETSTAVLNDPSCFAIYNLNDWLAYMSNKSRHRRNKTKKMHKAMYKIPDELWRDDPRTTASKHWENDIEKTNIDDMLLADDKTSSDELETEENRTSVKKSKVINEAGKGNNNVRGVNMSTSVDGHSNSVANAVLKEPVDDTILEKPKESGSETSAEAFFEAIPAEDAFNSLYSELVVARTQVEAMADELKFSMATNEMLKKELKRYKTTSAACTDELENFSQQINSQAEMLKGYSEKSVEQSNELKNLSEKNQCLLVELKSEKEQSETASLEFKELKNKLKMQNEELEKQKAELSTVKRLESIRLSEINSLKEKLEIQLKQGKVLKDLKSWESGELKRMKMEAISKTAKLKLIEEQDRMKAKDLERLNNDLQLRGKEVHSIMAMICCQSSALFRLRCLTQSTADASELRSEATAGSEQDSKTYKEIWETKSEIGYVTTDSLRDDLSKISEVLCTNETNAEQLKNEIAALLNRMQRLQGDCATASAEVLQLREANDSKSQELTLLKQRLSTNFQKFHTNQEFLSNKLLRSKVNEQLLTKALEKLGHRDESLTELLKASYETMNSHQNGLSQEVFQLRTKGEELASELQKSRSREEDAKKELQVEKTRTENLSTKLQHFEGKLDLGSDELRKFETRAESFLTELQMSRERESQLCDEVHQVRLQLQTSETQLRKSEESIGLLSKETEALKVSIDLLTAELEKSKTNEQSLLSELQSKSDGRNSSFDQKVVSPGKPPDVPFQANSGSEHACSTDCKANAEFNLTEESHLSEKENVVRTGRHDNGNVKRQPQQDGDRPVPVTSEPCSSVEKVKSSADFCQSENDRVIKGHPRGKVIEMLSTEVKDLTTEVKTGDVGAEKHGTYADQTKLKDAGKQKGSVSEKKTSAVGDSTTIDRHDTSGQLNVIRELEHKVALQSAEILQYEEKLRLLLYEILLHNQQNCCRNEAISSSQGDPPSAAKPDIDMIYDQLGKEKKFREDLFAWNELNTRELMKHVSAIQRLISSSHVQIEKLFNSFNKHQLHSDSKPCTRDTKSGTGSLSMQNKVTCGISEKTLAKEYSSEGSDSTTKSQDDTRPRTSLKQRKPHSTAFQKFSKLSRNEDQASATHQRLAEKQQTARRPKYRQEHNNSGQRDTKSCNFDSHGCSALTTNNGDTSDIAVFDHCEIDEAGSQTRSLTGLTRKQLKSPSAKRKLKEFEQLRARCENLLTSAACPTTGDTVPDTGEKSDARYCVSAPKTPGTVVTSDSDTPVDLQRTEQEAEWFHKDREQDAAYEALKHIKLNLNYFLESLTEVQPDKISLDVVQYPTAKDVSDIYEADTFVKTDFHIPNRRLVSSSASPEKASTGTKYNLQIPVSRLRDLIFPRCVEPSGRNLFTHRADAVRNSSAPGDQRSSSLAAFNVASSVPRKDVVLVKTRLPKYIRIDEKQSARNLAPKRPKIEFIDDHRSDAVSVFISPPSVVEAKGDSSSAICPSAAQCDRTVVCPNRVASVVHGERLPMDAANASNNRINRCPPPVLRGGGRKSNGYADIVNKRFTLIADRKRNSQGITRRILPAKRHGHL